MNFENHHTERKSLRFVTGKTADWEALARSCVCFANGAGGRLLIGMEDEGNMPPAGQIIPVELLDKLRKRIGELTVNVQSLPSIQTDSNGGQYIELMVERSPNVASTHDGRYFLRVGDTCKPILGDDVMRLASERPGRPWEAMDTDVPRSAADADKVGNFVRDIRNSDRVKLSVKEKSQLELLTHYGLVYGGNLTLLGVLMVGTAAHRRAFGTGPLVQALKYDIRRQKINKWVWDDYSHSPVELVEAIWREIPDFRESYEVADGMLRHSVPAYDEKVIRELLVNALVHRPYTQQGDIYLNLYPEYLEVVNPGRLPLGVTPKNILHASRRRNEGLARIFHDLGLMEREGSDRVKVTIQRRILRPEVLRLMTNADERFHLSQRERITLGVLAQSEGMTAKELAAVLEPEEDEKSLSSWLGRLLKLGLVHHAGRTRGTRYYVEPKLFRDFGLDATTSLKRIEPHRLLELVREDLRRYPNSKSGDISIRIGSEINRSQLRRTLKTMVESGIVKMTGERNSSRYSLADPEPD